MAVTLRPYQQQAVAQIRQHFNSGVRNVLFVLPTGGGKTYTFTYITQAAARKRNPVGILVHRKELLSQASISLASMGVEHGIIAPAPKVREIIHDHIELLGRSFVNSGSLVQVASVQSLSRPGRLAKHAHTFKLLIPDEAHHASAGSWKKVIDSAYNASTLGVTATPVRSDGQGLGRHCGGVFDTMVCGPSINELIESGDLVRPDVYVPPSDLDMTGVPKRGGEWAKKQTDERVAKSSIVGDAVQHYKRLVQGRPAIAFCVSVRAADECAAEFRSQGIRAVAISGTTPDAERRAAIRGLETGQVQLLAACDIISEGTDVPSVYAALLMRPTDSEGLYIQQCGRILRPAPGKDKAIILDHVGNCITHGLPDEERVWTLDGKEERQSSGEGEATGPAVRQCPECYAAHVAAPYCPACGHQYPIKAREIEQVEGELQKITEVERKKREWARRKEISDAKTLEELQALAKKLGYARGWAHKMAAVRKAKGAAA